MCVETATLLHTHSVLEWRRPWLRHSDLQLLELRALHSRGATSDLHEQLKEFRPEKDG